MKTARESSFFHTPLHSTPLLGGFPSEQCHLILYGKKLEWLGYPMVKKIREISLFVLAQLMNVTDRRTPHAGIYCAYAQHRAVMTSSRFSRWRISAILDYRDPIMGSLKSHLSLHNFLQVVNRHHSSKLLSFEKIVFFCILATDRHTDRLTDRRTTDRQLRCTKPLSLSPATN